MHPLLRNVVIGIVGLIIAGALATLALLGRDSDLSVLALLAAAMLERAGRALPLQPGLDLEQPGGATPPAGQAVIIAIGGGLMVLVAAVAIAGLLILVLLFFLG